MNDSRAATPANSTAPLATRKRRYWSPLSVFFVFAVAALAIQYIMVLGLVILAEYRHHPFSFNVALGPLTFWQANYHERVSNPEPGHYIGDFGGEAVIREGAVLVAFLIGVLAAIVQTRRVPAQ